MNAFKHGEAHIGKDFVCMSLKTFKVQPIESAQVHLAEKLKPGTFYLMICFSGLVKGNRPHQRQLFCLFRCKVENCVRAHINNCRARK
jgi:hypothetical protein